MAINNLVEISQYCLFFEWFTKLQTSIIEKRHQNKNDNLLIKKNAYEIVFSRTQIKSLKISQTLILLMTKYQF